MTYRGAYLALAALLALGWFERRGHDNAVSFASNMRPVTALASLHAKEGPPNQSLTNRTTSAAASDNVTNDAGQVQHAVHVALRELRELDTTDEASRTELLARLNAIITGENAAEIARDLSADELRTDFGTSVLLNWLQVDAAAAAEWLRSHDVRDEQVAELGAALATTPERLELVAATVANSSAEVPLLRAAILRMADSNPALAADLSTRLPAGAVRTDAAQTIVYAWAAKDLARALQYIESRSDASERESLFAVSAKAIASSDPDAAAYWLSDSVHRPELLDATVDTIVGQWAIRDPAHTAQWIASFASGDARQHAIETLFSAWSQTDAAAANTWLEQLPDYKVALEHLAAAAAERERPKDD